MTQGSTRRAVLATGAVALAAGCSDSNTDGGGSSSPSSAPPSASSEAMAQRATVSPSHGSAGGKELARTSDIPVGGGKIFKEQRIVVTQPRKDEFKAFTATCTHQGCTMSQVAGGTIHCPCHGSMFHVTDGSVAHGPATRPLTPMKIEVEGNSIRLT